MKILAYKLSLRIVTADWPFLEQEQNNYTLIWNLHTIKKLYRYFLTTDRQISHHEA